MGYGKLNQTDPTSTTTATSPFRRKKLIFITLLSLLLLVTAATTTTILLTKPKPATNPTPPRKPTQAISKACSRTRYPSLCINSLLDFPPSLTADEQTLIHISFNLTLQHLNKALYFSSQFSSLSMSPPLRSAYDACLELLDDSIDSLSKSLSSISLVGERGTSSEDIVTWLSAALTNQDTCTDGITEARDGNGNVKDLMREKLKDLTELLSNCLALFSGSDLNNDKDFDGIPIKNRRRRLLIEKESEGNGNFPAWMNRRERKLLSLPVTEIQADIVVSKDGNGTCKTISEAIKLAPQFSSRRTIIFIKAGRYEENNLKVGRKKINLMFVGEGKGKTVISGAKSVFDNMTTFHTASFAATGAGLILRDMTFENSAGPGRHQAVALRIGADHAVVYRCNVIGYQDTLYVHSNRQFFRECDIYGTVDFIFGNAAVVFQNCSIYARKAMDLQKNTITAQNRKDPNQNTGISIHACRIMATPDLTTSNTSNPTYLGRPWKLYSRVVFMLSYIGGHVHPHGWLEWNATFALDTLYYGEYMNYGPGGAVGQRVTWPGYRVITSTVEANKFTVAQFIYGSSWLPSTGVAFLGGLNV